MDCILVGGPLGSVLIEANVIRLQLLLFKFLPLWGGVGRRVESPSKYYLFL